MLSGEVPVEKLPGVENPADALTKHLAGPALRDRLKRMNVVAEKGRAESAPTLP